MPLLLPESPPGPSLGAGVGVPRVPGKRGEARSDFQGLSGLSMRGALCPRGAPAAESGKDGIPNNGHTITRESCSGQSPLCQALDASLPENVAEWGLRPARWDLTPNLSAILPPRAPTGGWGRLLNGTYNAVKIRKGKEKAFDLGRPTLCLEAD